TDTKWLFGLIPSSHTAIDRQFHFPPGTVTLSEAGWEKAQRALDLKPFRLKKTETKTKAKKASAPAAPEPAPNGEPAVLPDAVASLLAYLTRPPALAREDEEQLLAWCVGIVELARKNGYLATTAD